jgi:hypothetical protein
MSLLPLAVSLLVLDTLATAWLLVRGRGRRRGVRVVPVPMIDAEGHTVALDHANQEIACRQALLRSPDVLIAGVPRSAAELRLTGARRAAVDELHDPTPGERRCG